MWSNQGYINTLETINTIGILMFFIGLGWYILVNSPKINQKNNQNIQNGKNKEKTRKDMGDNYFELIYSPPGINNKIYKKIKEDKKPKEEVNIALVRNASFPNCYKVLGFNDYPKSKKEIRDKYMVLAKELHPDAGGSPEGFIKISEAYKESLNKFKKTEEGKIL